MVAPPRVRAGGSHSLYMLMRVMMAAGGNGCVRVSPGGLGDLTGYIYICALGSSVSVGRCFVSAGDTHLRTPADGSVGVDHGGRVSPELHLCETLMQITPLRVCQVLKCQTLLLLLLLL